MNKKIIDLKEKIHNTKELLRSAIANKEVTKAEAMKADLSLLEQDLLAAEKEYTAGINNIGNGGGNPINGSKPSNKQIFNKTEKMYNANNFTPEERELSLGKTLKGILVNDWKGADNELKAFKAAQSIQNNGTQFTIPTPLSTQLIDLIREESVLVNLGATTIPMTSAKMNVATLLEDLEPQFRAHGSLIHESKMSFGNIELQACSLAAMTTYNREDFADSIFVENTLPRVFARSLALELDRAGLYGMGATDVDETRIEPLGVYHNEKTIKMPLNLENGFRDFTQAIVHVRKQNTEPTAMALSPVMSGQIEDQTDTTGQPLNRPRSMFNLPEHVSNQVEANHAWIGDWSQVLFGTRQDIEIMFSQEAGDNFSRNRISARAILRADVAVARAEMMVVLDDSQAPEVMKAAKKK